MCAIYTAVRPPSSAEQLAALARDNESRTYGANRRTLGHRAIAELVLVVAPPSHATLVHAILERDLWGFLTPAASRGNHAITLAAANPDLAVPRPLWPESVELACLVGAPPAQYLGNNRVMLRPELVARAVEALGRHEDASEHATYLREFFASTLPRLDAILLHWDYR